MSALIDGRTPSGRTVRITEGTGGHCIVAIAPAPESSTLDGELIVPRPKGDDDE